MTDLRKQEGITSKAAMLSSISSGVQVTVALPDISYPSLQVYMAVSPMELPVTEPGTTNPLAMAGTSSQRAKRGKINKSLT